MKRIGIDVSVHQGKIDWARVKAAGIDFAIIRCGFGGNITKQDDAQFSANVEGCKKNGIPYGVYIYSYAENVENAKSEADHVLRLIGDSKPEYPIYFDLEDAKTTGTKDNATILSIAKTFVDKVEKAGFWVGIYANKNWNVTKLTDPWYNTKARWVAQYAKKCTYTGGQYAMWQYTSSGKVDGIAGNVDMNECYADYPAMVADLYKRTKPETKPEPIQPQIVVGAKVKIKAGAKTFTGGSLASFVYPRTYIVRELKGARAVLTFMGIVVAAVNTNDLYIV